MEGLLFFQVYPSDGFRFILIPDGNPSHEFPVLDGNPSSNMNSAIVLINLFEIRTKYAVLTETGNIFKFQIDWMKADGYVNLVNFLVKPYTSNYAEIVVFNY